ncbi:MAG: hypothetical protein R2795_23540 [Saprospiraceae bacterium]
MINNCRCLLPLFTNAAALFAIDFATPFQEAHQAICAGMEQVTIRYQSALENTDLLTLLAGSRSKDMALERTTQGIHRDDFVFELEGHPLKRLGSQGNSSRLCWRSSWLNISFYISKGTYPHLVIG